MTIRVQTKQMKEKNDLVTMEKLINNWIQPCRSEELLRKKVCMSIPKPTVSDYHYIIALPQQ
jgi:hypothetical protein